MTSSAQSILEKPLRQLTEDEISQLTREDCRKFLKDKGMRRPSWNKSQAIQQVISLKALLEGKSDNDSDAAKCKSLKRIVVASSASEDPLPHGSSDSPESEKQQSGVGGTDMEETIPFGRKDMGELGVHGDVGSLPAEPMKEAVSPRRLAPEDAFKQMTIFYCGKVNVYEKMSADKARAIMQLAASPIRLPHHKSFNGSMAVWSFSSHMQATSEGVGHFSPRATYFHGVPADLDGQLNRKLSLQRYREKRKDSLVGRVKLKSRKEMGPASSSFETFINKKIRMPVIDRQLGKSTTGSSLPHGLAHGKDSMSFSWSDGNRGIDFGRE